MGDVAPLVRICPNRDRDPWDVGCEESQHLSEPISVRLDFLIIGGRTRCICGNNLGTSQC